jgi:hypothetical protein
MRAATRCVATNALIALCPWGSFARLGGAAGAREARRVQFKAQLRELMTAIDLTTPHYIRCINPNAEKAPNKFGKDEVRPSPPSPAQRAASALHRARTRAGPCLVSARSCRANPAPPRALCRAASPQRLTARASVSDAVGWAVRGRCSSNSDRAA